MVKCMSEEGFYDFVEIGTSDWDTLIEKADDSKIGVSIEPFQIYLDKLPDRKNVTKICAAISDEEGEVDIHYIPQENIEKYRLPSWVKGTPRLYERHPFVLKLLANEAEDNPLEKAIDPDNIYAKMTIKVRRLKSIIDQFNIKFIKILKIDTEGMDGRILLDYFRCCEHGGYPFPFCVQYEHVLLSSKERLYILSEAQRFGYLVQEERLENTILIKDRN